MQLTDDGDGAFLGGADDRFENALRAFVEVVPLKHARRSAVSHRIIAINIIIVIIIIVRQLQARLSD